MLTMHKSHTMCVIRNGQIKAAPVSAFSLSECSSHDELSGMCFSRGTEMSKLLTKTPGCATSHSNYGTKIYDKNNATAAQCKRKATDISNSGETADTLMAFEQNSCTKETRTESISRNDSQVFSHMQNGEKIPIPLTLESRQGRAKQRWDRCAATNRIVRLTAGCIPITNDGKILFISSAKKKEWILPKGGWESDEEREASAVRETYEEAGVLGTLGPMLKEITFETRKGRARRIEREKADSDEFVKNHMDGDYISSHISTSSSEEEFGAIEEKYVGKTKDISSGQAGKTKKHELCRMSLFPLYISEILDKWPENGRTRKVFDIDEAINMTTRDELKDILIELKESGLHLVGKKNGRCVVL